ncbi:ABC transporter ATP-binding protein [Spiroplasma endosymbiont of Amphibalanus improvisus]|uniref:ABC transporter ATP-binding protein n=1 Tax=Spiroplasma endosymbiont of Amphibalanus improvisus TaxID=3066327 RepID=UPI00313E6636
MDNINIIEVKNIIKQFDGEVILKDLSFNIKQGEFISILGPSGCGKTTTLNLINGKEKPDSGDILFQGESLKNIPMNKRLINTIFQNYALFPRMTVFQNIAYGPIVSKKKYNDYAPEVFKFLNLVGLKGFEDKNVSDLSGGQQQRVALARALINKPQVLLLDEPFAALDVQLRKKMQQELKKIQKEIGITFVLITHDQEEALSLSDRVIVLNKGVIQQVGSPEEIYNEPENKWVANFIGESNIIYDGVFIKDNCLGIDHLKIDCSDTGFGQMEKNIDIVIRPEDIDIVPLGKGYFDGEVISTVFKGVNWEIIFKTKYRNFIIHTTDLVEIGKKMSIIWNAEDNHVMWKEVE